MNNANDITLNEMNSDIKSVDFAHNVSQHFIQDKFEIKKRSYSYRLMCVIEGSCEFVTKRGCEVLQKGDIFFFCPGDVYNTLGEFSLLNIFFDFSAESDHPAPQQLFAYEETYNRSLLREKKNFIGNPLFNKSFPIKKLPQIFRLAEKISKEYATKNVHYKKLSNLYLSQLLVVTARLFDEKERKPYSKQLLGLCEEVTAYVNENVANITSAGEVCKKLNYHPAYINRIMKIATGKTLYQYILDARLDHADSLLKKGNISVTDVAMLLGFCDSSHFGKQYQKKFGRIPSAVKYHNPY